MNRSDWTLLVLAAAEGQRLEPVQLQKIMFLLGKAFPEAVASGGYYDFQPHNYGAFDPEVYRDAEQMAAQGMAIVGQAPGGWLEYGATPKGLTQAKELEKGTDPKALDYVRRAVAWARSLSFVDLIRAVYQAYPETKVNSIFKDK